MVNSRLELLPDELWNEICIRLNRAEQSNTALASWHCYHRVVPHLYRVIELVDCRNDETGDEHDDTPMIRILLVLANNPYLASNVQDLTHKCHLPPPDPCFDLPCESLEDSNLSRDGRTLTLLSRAIDNLVNVNTLRIIYGHHRITIGLLEGFFAKAGNHPHSITRLWLETSCLENLFQRAGANALTDGLRSIRIRRLRAKTELSTVGETEVWVRDRLTMERIVVSQRWRPLPPPNGEREFSSLGRRSSAAARLDEGIYGRFPGTEGLGGSEDEFDHSAADSTCHDKTPLKNEEPAWVVSELVTASSSTLTSLNLDWVFDVMPLLTNNWITHTTFPNLRAFQVRNAATPAAKFSADSTIALLKGNWLQFLERHPQIRCLAWPLEHFFHPASPPYLTSRAEDVVMTLGRTLKELRIDADILFHEEPVTDQIDDADLTSRRTGTRRRFFVEHIAPYMSTLEVLKVEGGIPFDERNEIVRAVRLSPLRKLVLIGISFPLVDTFIVRRPSPARGALIGDMVNIGETHREDLAHLLETKDWASLQVEDSLSSSTFVPTYNPSKYTLIETITLHHASTITNLKLCGFRGAPDLHRAMAVQLDALAPLRHLHNLRHLTMSFSMSTELEGSDRDDQIRSYWHDAQSPRSTALAMPAGTEDQNPWAKLLTERYAPAKLAERVGSMLTPRLSPQALARKGGLSVNALLLLYAHEIFHLGVQLGVNGEVFSYRGPMSEGRPERVREKLENRAWF